jgi:hypothetical protein
MLSPGTGPEFKTKDSIHAESAFNVARVYSATYAAPDNCRFNALIAAALSGARDWL